MAAESYLGNQMPALEREEGLPEILVPPIDCCVFEGSHRDVPPFHYLVFRGVGSSVGRVVPGFSRRGFLGCRFWEFVPHAMEASHLVLSTYMISALLQCEKNSSL